MGEIGNVVKRSEYSDGANRCCYFAGTERTISGYCATDDLSVSDICSVRLFCCCFSCSLFGLACFGDTFRAHCPLTMRFECLFSVINNEFRQYRGPRDANTLMTFIEDKKWKELEPISAWWHPDSIQMTFVSYFFKLSHYLKEVNNVMLVDYGLPPWVTYVLFAIATILLGAILGLVLVSIIDLFFPPVPRNSRKSFSQSQAGANVPDEDARDELEDDAGPNNDAKANDSSTSEGEKYSGSDSGDDESGASAPPHSLRPALLNRTPLILLSRNEEAGHTKVIARGPQTQAEKGRLGRRRRTHRTIYQDERGGLSYNQTIYWFNSYLIFASKQETGRARAVSSSFARMIRCEYEQLYFLRAMRLSPGCRLLWHSPSIFSSRHS